MYSDRRISIPIQHANQDTIAQWIEDPRTGRDLYRMRIYIDEFHRNEVNVRVEGRKLFVYGERIENKSQGTSKKIIEKYYDLPSDVDTFRPYVTFPSSMIMQVDFPCQSTSQNRQIPIKNRSRQTSSSPALSSILEEESIRTYPSSSSSSSISSSTSIFPSNFDSKRFYESIFQPEILIDDQNQRYIELKLDVHNYNPDDIRVSINDNDLIVRIRKTNFYKQITLPSNIDLSSLTVHHDRKLYIKIKLLDEHSSFKYM